MPVEQKLSIAPCIADKACVMGNSGIVYSDTLEALLEQAGIRKEWLER